MINRASEFFSYSKFLFMLVISYIDTLDLFKIVKKVFFFNLKNTLGLIGLKSFS